MNYSKLHGFSKKQLITLLFTATIALTSGCAENDMSDLTQFTVETRLKYLGKVEALPTITPYESYHYSVADKRDPFRASVSLVKTIALKRASNGLKPSSVRNKEELENYALKSLIMVGAMNNNGQNWAIVKAPDNSIFRVKRGNYMGENNGKILKITESNISLKEIINDGLGGWIERKNKLSISE